MRHRRIIPTQPSCFRSMPMLNFPSSMTEQEKMLQEAVEAGQSGDQAHARELLLKLLSIDNREPLYWLLMSTCVDSKEEREYCLYNVLKLDPENSAAKHDLALIGSMLPNEKEENDFPDLIEDWQTSEIAAPKIEKKKRAPKVEPWPLSNILGAVGVGLVLIVLGYFATSSGLINLNSGNDATPNSVPGILISSPNSASSNESAQSTATLQSSASAEVLETHDPSELMDSPNTATPFFVETPHPNSSAFETGMQAFRAENWVAAIEALRQHISSEPNSADAEYYIGHSYLNLNESESALEAFERSIALDAPFAAAYLGRALASLALGLRDTAVITDLNTALLLDKNYAEGYIARARYYYGLGDPIRALGDLVFAENLTPNSVEVHALKAEIHLNLEAYEEARISAEHALDLDISLISNYLVLSDIYVQIGEFDAAIGLMQSYLNFVPTNAHAWQSLGRAFLGNGNNEQSLSAFDKALELDSLLPIANYYRALAHLQALEAIEAIELIRIAIEGDPEWFEARIALAEALLLNNDPGAAFFEANASAGLIESDEQKAALHFWRGSSLEALEQHETALGDWISLIALPIEIVPEDWRQIALENSLVP